MRAECERAHDVECAADPTRRERREYATLAAVGMPHSRSIAPTARWRADPRSASTPGQVVPPAPDASTHSTPAARSRASVTGDKPQPVSFAITGTRSASTSAAIVSMPPRKSRSPSSWTSSCAGFKCTHSASAPTASTSSATAAVPNARACTTPTFPSSATSGASSRTR